MFAFSLISIKKYKVVTVKSHVYPEIKGIPNLASHGNRKHM